MRCFLYKIFFTRFIYLNIFKQCPSCETIQQCYHKASYSFPNILFLWNDSVFSILYCTSIVPFHRGSIIMFMSWKMKHHCANFVANVFFGTIHAINFRISCNISSWTFIISRRKISWFPRIFEAHYIATNVSSNSSNNSSSSIIIIIITTIATAITIITITITIIAAHHTKFWRAGT